MDGAEDAVSYPAEPVIGRLLDGLLLAHGYRRSASPPPCSFAPAAFAWVRPLRNGTHVIEITVSEYVAASAERCMELTLWDRVARKTRDDPRVLRLVCARGTHWLGVDPLRAVDWQQRVVESLHELLRASVAHT